MNRFSSPTVVLVRRVVPLLALAACGSSDGNLGSVDPCESLGAVPAVSFALTPESAYTDDDLVATIQDDIPGALYRVRWSQDGMERADLDVVTPSVATLSQFETYKDEIWSASVTRVPPTDLGAACGTPSTAEVVIQNSPPVATIDEPFVVVGSDEDLAVDPHVVDADEDTFEVAYAWAVDGEAVDGAAEDVLSADLTSRGEVWTVTVTPMDPAGAGESVVRTFYIDNATPGAPEVALNPPVPVPGRDLACDVLEMGVDLDGDVLDVRIRWTRNGTEVATGRLAHARPGDAVPGSEIEAGDTWRCESWLDDGLDTSPVAVVEALVPVPSCTSGAALEQGGIPGRTVCAQSFDMGCTPAQQATAACTYAEIPAHRVTLTRDLWVSETEITQAMYASVMGSNPSFASTCGGDCPVESVSWHMAAAFANAMSASASVDACYACSGTGASLNCSPLPGIYTCDGFRLPTEAEWEGAARCGRDDAYAGSSVVASVGWYYLNAAGATHPVGSLDDNACGLYDMTGNVHEWVQDSPSTLSSSSVAILPFSSDYLEDPLGVGTGTLRGMRGGSILYGMPRLSYRLGSVPTVKSKEIGIRLVRTLASDSSG